MRRYVWLLIGVLLATAIGLSTDQIIENVYDSTNRALRFNAVVGGGGGSNPTPPPTATAQPTVTPVPTATPQPTPTSIVPAYRAVIYTGTGTTTNLATSGNNFMALGTSFASSTTETARSGPYGIAFTLKNLSCVIGFASFATQNWTITVRSGTCGSALSDSLITCPINGPATACQDNSHTLSVSANQCVSINAVGTNTPNATVLNCGIEADY